MANKLKSLAQSMRAEATRAGVSRLELQRGLILNLATEEPAPAGPVVTGDLTAEDLTAGRHNWRLELSRRDRKPSELEIRIIRDSFGVPESVDREDGVFWVVFRWPIK